MNLFREDRILREKNMENIKHMEVIVPGVAFYSADGVDKQSLRLDEHKNRVASVGIDLRATFATAPLSLDQPPPLYIAHTSLATLLLFSFFVYWF